MKRTHLAIGIVGIATAVGAATLTCRVLILRFTPKLIATHKLDHKPSQKTLDAWAAWDAKRTLRELDLACPPVNLADMDAAVDFIPAEPVPAWEPVEIDPDVAVPALEAPPMLYPASGYELTTFVPYGGGSGGGSPVPEPWTFGMVGLGMIAMFVNLNRVCD